MDRLIAKGVIFEQCIGNINTDEKEIRRSGGEGTDAAWFPYPAGNMRSVMKHSEKESENF